MPVIRALREAGYDVIAISEIARGAADDHVLERAMKEKRVLITEDRDFGELVYARGRSSTGVVLLRFHSRALQVKAATLLEAISKLGSRLEVSFTVVEPGRVRISRRPQAGD